MEDKTAKMTEDLQRRVTELEQMVSDLKETCNTLFNGMIDIVEEMESTPAHRWVKMSTVHGRDVIINLARVNAIAETNASEVEIDFGNNFRFVTGTLDEVAAALGLEFDDDAPDSETRNKCCKCCKGD